MVSIIIILVCQKLKFIIFIFIIMWHFLIIFAFAEKLNDKVMSISIVK